MKTDKIVQVTLNRTPNFTRQSDTVYLSVNLLVKEPTTAFSTNQFSARIVESFDVDVKKEVLREIFLSMVGGDK